MKHGAELDFVFSRAPSTADDDEPTRLADLMVGYWTNFARTGNPNEPLEHPRTAAPLPFSTSPSGPLYWPRTFGDAGPQDRAQASTQDFELHVAGADFAGCGGGEGECDISISDGYHDRQCDWWAERWHPMDGSFTAEQQVGFGGCIPCWGERPDPSEFGPVPVNRGC